MPGGLTDPISAQNVVNRFADYVRGAANSGISWGTNSYPFGEFGAIAFVFGGDTNGKPIEINGNNLGGVGALAVAQTTYNVLIEETRRYTRIRLMRAVLFVAGGGGNTGTRPTPGVVYDNTAVGHLNSNYQAGSLSADRNNVFAGNIMTRGGTAAMFNNMRAAYQAVRNSSIYFQVDVCHASCHSNCHSSRSRR
jgi:hypothetical protein